MLARVAPEDKLRIARALRKTDEQQLLVFDSFEKGRPPVHRETPMNRSYVERLR